MSIGEVMASKDGFNVCSSDSSRQISNQTEVDEDISMMTSATDNKIQSICMICFLNSVLYKYVLLSDTQ